MTIIKSVISIVFCSIITVPAYAWTYVHKHKSGVSNGAETIYSGDGLTRPYCAQGARPQGKHMHPTCETKVKEKGGETVCYSFDECHVSDDEVANFDDPCSKFKYFCNPDDETYYRNVEEHKKGLTAYAECLKKAGSGIGNAIAREQCEHDKTNSTRELLNN